ncbi:WGR domain-containing protein [Aminobacter aminovorans]|uniref:WGR domain-containing protein n=2 Tax=Aminobacter TaxID=31988 RepID=UPI00285AAC31|nr:WGR domain-containing protein [Aminobacter aminovorans]MDR7223053.1 putative DNA-binding WGR domain protein [Aminobacter aminovorans]
MESQRAILPFMQKPSPILHLQRRDPSRNMARFYCLSVEGSLFGDAVLVREWGRIGTLGRRRLDLFASAAQAQEALRLLAASKVQRGYSSVG